MSRSEVMTILVLFHRSGFRDLKKVLYKIGVSVLAGGFSSTCSVTTVCRIAERLSDFAWEHLCKRGWENVLGCHLWIHRK